MLAKCHNQYFCSFFCNAFSVTRRYIVVDRVTSEWGWIEEDKHHALSGIRNHDNSDHAIKTYALDSAAIGTGLSIWFSLVWSCTNYEAPHFIYYNFLLLPCLLCSNILLSTPFLKTVTLRSSLTVTDQVSYLYKIKYKIIFMYILIYSVWLRTGRPGDQVRSPAEARGFFL
jgi:hypothetical protein